MPRQDTFAYLELEKLFDQAAQEPSGIIHYECTHSRAKWLASCAANMAKQSAIASLALDKTDPRYALGAFWMITVTPTESGLWVRAGEDPEMRPAQILIYSTYTGRSVSIERATPEQADTAAANLQMAKYRLQKSGLLPDSDALALIIIEKDPKNPCIVWVHNDKLLRGNVHGATEEQYLAATASAPQNPEENDENESF